MYYFEGRVRSHTDQIGRFMIYIILAVIYGLPLLLSWLLVTGYMIKEVKRLFRDLK